MKFLVIGGLPQSLIIFRGPLLKEIIDAGHTVFACANGRDSTIEKKLQEIGVTYIPIRLSRAGMNPIDDIKTFFDLMRLISRVKPDSVFSYTIKPVVYGGIAARFHRVPSIYSFITGIGYSFMESQSFHQSFLRTIARMLYRISLKKSRKVFFQNSDDRSLFLDKGLVHPGQTVIVNGSGVDLNFYSKSPLPKEHVFLMISRLLTDKGVREYVKAAERIKMILDTRFLLVGYLDPNPSSIKESELRQWQKAGTIEFLGFLDDVRPAIKNCRFYILPSYWEGTPRTVLEAMSMGRPIITTDVPGCRETVILTPEGKRQRDRGEEVMQGENGFLIRPRDFNALEKAMKILLENPNLAESMAKRSREIAEEKYDVHKVNAVILKEMGLT